MTTAYLVQHGEKESLPGEPGLTQAGGRKARAGQRLRGQGIQTFYSSPMRRARETGAITATGDLHVVMVASTAHLGP
jgi:broad specificity phosphatase PhoE